MERILCAAIYVDTGLGEPARRSHSYPTTGLVFSGWRHSDCFITLNAWEGLLPYGERELIGKEKLAGRDQGFLTSTGRYVGRKEAADIARMAGQILRPERQGTIDLFSEDLY